MSSILGPDQAEGLRKMMQGHTKIIAVTSGKGGVGKSNFSLNLGISLANMKQSPKKVVILDADLGLANINVLLGVIPKFNLSHVVKGQKEMREIIYGTDVGIDIIGGASGIANIANIEDDDKKRMIDALKEVSYADYVIIDTAAGIGENVTSFVEAAHEAVVVTTPEPTSITDAYGVIKTIVGRTEYPSIKLVVNRARNPKEALVVSRKIIDIGAQFLNVKIDNLGYIYEDAKISEAVKKQIPFLTLYPNSKASECVDHIARRVMNLHVPDQSGWGKFIKSFVG